MKKYIALVMSLVMVLGMLGCDKPAEQPPHTHTYTEGKCTGCSEEQPNYRALEGNRWTLAGLTESGEELDVISIWFNGENTIISASYWGKFSSLDKEEQNWYLSEGGRDLYEFEGQQYYSLGFGTHGNVRYTVNGDVVEMQIEYHTNGTMTWERIAGDQYKITAHTGTILDEIIHNIIIAKGVFVCDMVGQE